MAVTAKRLYGNDNAPNTLTTAYTVPASTTTVITCITLANKTASPATMIVKAAGVTVIPTTSIDGGATVVIDLKITLSATETIQVQAGTASAIAVTISGVEVV
jgi:hypothetical protein